MIVRKFGRSSAAVRPNRIFGLSLPTTKFRINIDYFVVVTVEGNGAGFGNLEIVVNGGRASCHVSRIEQQEKFSANFIPHEAGRHRLDVTFNGDKVPHSPWFCEVKK